LHGAVDLAFIVDPDIDWNELKVAQWKHVPFETSRGAIRESSGVSLKVRQEKLTVPNALSND
jgi:hypothetical protein